MKAALAIHLLMLSLTGSLAWHAGGSPLWLIVLLVVVLLHAPASRRPQPLADALRLLASALLFGYCALDLLTNQGMAWPLLLAFPHLLSALECLSRIQHPEARVDIGFARFRSAMFTPAFYATLVLAFLLLRPGFFNLDPSIRMSLALACTLLGLIAWEAGRPGRLAPGKSARLGGSGVRLRLALLAVSVVAFALVFTVALPWASEALCGFSSSLESSPKPAERMSSETSQPGNDPQGTGSGDDDNSDAGPEQANRTGQIKLPMRGTLELTDEVRVVVKFDDPARVQALAAQGPLYLRTQAASDYSNDRWRSGDSAGQWLEDSNDGRSDGNVDVAGPPLPGDISHEVFLDRSSGQALPALAGVTRFALPEILALQDDGFQTRATGRIRYKAWSRPVDLQSLPGSGLKPGSPGPQYVTRLETPFGARLTEIAEAFATERPDLPGRIGLLRNFFQSGFTYSRTVENPSGQPPLENFLFHEKRGYCDFFASSAALILRHMGIPSRVAYGYLGGEQDPGTDAWIFRELHAHAWTEIFVEDHGWVICDFTPSANDSPSRPRTAVPLDLAAFRDVGTDREAGKGRPWSQAGSLQLPSPWVVIAAVLALLGAILVILSRQRSPEQRAATKAARRRARSERQPGYFLEFLQLCSSMGHPRREGQTLMEFHRDLKQARFCDDDFDELADYYHRSRYADAPEDPAIERRLLRHIRQFRKARADGN